MRGIFQKIPEFCNGWSYSLGKIILEYFDLNQFQLILANQLWNKGCQLKQVYLYKAKHRISLRRIADKRLLKSGYYSILKSAGNPPEMKCTPSDIEPYRIAKSWSRIGQFSLNKHAHWLKMWTLIPGAASEAGPGLCLWCGDWLSAK